MVWVGLRVTLEVQQLFTENKDLFYIPLIFK